MRTLAAVFCVVIACEAAAAAPHPSFALLVNETQTVQMMGVTAAWAIDGSIVDASAQQGGVLIHARAAGATKVIVISVTGQHTYDVTVSPRPGTGARAVAPRADRATAEVRYSSAAQEIQNTVSLTREDRGRKTEVAARTIHQMDSTTDRPRTSIATASIRLFRRNRELTLLDRDVDHSPLTLSATPLRGIHYVDDHWRLHAGATAYTAYRSFLIPTERRWVGGGGYAFRTSAHSTLTPTFFAYRDEGTVASLLYEYDDEEQLLVRGEVGWSDGLGAAAQLAYDTDDDRVMANIRYRPDGFAVPSSATPRGFFGDAAWTHEYRGDSSVSTSWSATDTAGLRMMSASVDADHRLTRRLSAIAGATWATFDNARTISIPLGIRIDGARGGAGITYRYSQSAKYDGGHGLRLYGRATRGHFSASAYADHQRNVPTLEVIFAERPDLAVALAELGILATTPADLARALREHAALAELGFIEGLTLELAPSRTQLGLEVVWLGTTAARQQVRARLLHNVTESVARRMSTTIASLSYSRALSSGTDVFGTWTYWRTAAVGQEPRVQPFLEVGVRQRLDGMIPGGSGTIRGVVFADEDLDGRSDGSGVNAEVELDGSRKTRTRADGTFAFNQVPRGSHRVVARVPDRPEAYFTTASRVEAMPGDEVAFGVAFTPARLLARIVDDTGAGLAGVRVTITRGAQSLSATSASDGELVLTAPPGEWQMRVVADSIPAGYEVAGTEGRAVMLDRAQPLQVEQVLPALRTISGRTAPHAEIAVQPLNRTVRADEEGQFTIRSLPAGEVVLASGGVTQRVELPRTPVAMTFDLTPQITELAPRTDVRGERRSRLGEYVVQIGAFRIHANAVAAAARARAAGVRVVIEPSGALILVRSEPIESRDAAQAVAGQLNDAGVDAVVVPR